MKGDVRKHRAALRAWLRANPGLWGTLASLVETCRGSPTLPTHALYRVAATARREGFYAPTTSVGDIATGSLRTAVIELLSVGPPR